MNQKEIEALIEKAKAGDADAQYMFGLLNSFNGYYEQACGCMRDAAGSPFNFAHFHSELIKEEYFHIMYDRWELYLAGKLMAKDIKPAKNAKYLISIIHYMLENNAELRRQ